MAGDVRRREKKTFLMGRLASSCSGGVYCAQVGCAGVIVG